MKTVRMIGTGAVTEVNFSAYGRFVPMDDGSFAIPEAAVGEAIKASLTVRELTQSERVARIADAIADLDDGETKTMLREAHRQSQVALWRKLRPDLVEGSPAA